MSSTPETTTDPTKPPAPSLDPFKGALAAFASNIVSSGGAVAVLAWLVLVQFPEQQKQFLEELRIERQTRNEQTVRLTSAIADLADEVKELRRAKE